MRKSIDDAEGFVLLREYPLHIRAIYKSEKSALVDARTRPGYVVRYGRTTDNRTGFIAIDRATAVTAKRRARLSPSSTDVQRRQADAGTLGAS